MHLWLYEDNAPFSFSLADEQTTLCVALIAAGALEELPEAEVIDFAQARAARGAEVR